MKLIRSLIVSLAVPVCASASVDFGRDVFPVLKRACFDCHGPEANKGSLRLHDRVSALKGGDHGAVIVAGRPDKSELLRRVSLPRADKEAMPRRGTPLTSTEIGLLRAWITDGAVWPDSFNEAAHWAYVKPVKAQLPAVKDAEWARNAIDRFVLARLEREGLRPSKQADTATLVRRLYLALIGLPPAAEEVARLEKLGSPLPQAEIEKLVDRLLRSEEFGVRWARPWLDLARYADSHGFQRDDLREIWGFRDWVVNALNADMPFTQFTIEQVGGDLLPGATQDQIIATGFHRCTPTNVEAGTDPEESRINQVIDRVNTTGAVWLGTTLECAQCHNHKYDPFSMKDYYQLLAYFNNTEKEAERTNPKVPGSIQFTGTPLAMAKAENTELRKLEAERAELEARMTQLGGTTDKDFNQWRSKMADELARPLQEKVLDVVEFVSESGSQHKELPDGSVLLVGKPAPLDTYRMVLRGGDLKQISGIKLEALTDESLPGKGPGRGDAARPNFVLTSFEARTRAADANDDAGKPLHFVSAKADFAQRNFDPAGALDDDEKTAWAINPEFGKPHWAVFQLDGPLNLDARTELVISLVQNYGAGRLIGRVRISAVMGSLAAANLPGEIAALLRKPRLSRRELAVLREHFDSDMPGVGDLKRQMSAVDRKIKALRPPTTEVMKELPEPRMTAMFKRGVFSDPGDPVKPGTPAVLPSIAGDEGRVTLAKWLVSPENPLTARVTVNRWWAEMFGHGIVTTLEDFGSKGEPPTHPEMLDWLAVDFMQQGWSMKKLIRLIATSATFCQDSAVSPALLEHDDQNLLYARGPRLRMDAEGVRDNALAIAGLLSTAKGGPPIYPPQPDGLWRKVGGQQYNYAVSEGERRYRRGLYVVLKRGAPYPSFVNFDASARMACVVKRSRSNTPLQALTLLNDPVYVEAAKAFADRLAKELPNAGDDERITRAFRIAVAREPSYQELTVLRDLLHAQKNDWHAVTSALLNLDETITRP